MVLHAASHLTIKRSATDDDDPDFIREFHRTASSVLSELFRTQFQKKTPKTERKNAAPEPSKRLPLTVSDEPKGSALSVMTESSPKIEPEQAELVQSQKPRSDARSAAADQSAPPDLTSTTRQVQPITSVVDSDPKASEVESRTIAEKASVQAKLEQRKVERLAKEEPETNLAGSSSSKPADRASAGLADESMAASASETASDADSLGSRKAELRAKLQQRRAGRLAEQHATSETTE